MTHELKIHKQQADAKLVGDKFFEIRRNDHEFQKGDIVRYTVIDPKTGEPWVAKGFPGLVTNQNGFTRVYKTGRHPLEACDFLITYVCGGVEGLDKGYCVYADRPVPKAKAKRKGEPEATIYPTTSTDLGAVATPSNEAIVETVSRKED